MAKLKVIPSTAERTPLPEPFSIELVRGSRSWRARCPADCPVIDFKDLRAGDLYQVRVRSANFRGVESFFLRDDDSVPVLCTLRKSSILAMHPLDFDRLDDRMKGLLKGRASVKTAGAGQKCNARSHGGPPERCLLRRRISANDLSANKLPSRVVAEEELAKSIYRGLRGKILAGLLNLYVKMRCVEVPGDVIQGRRTVWEYVEGLDCLEQDRVHGSVDRALHVRVPGAKWFHSAGGSEHDAPECHARVDSFKTKEHYGNLQLTFFGSVSGDGGMKVDADVDDAAGIEHVGQYLRNKKFFLSLLPFVNEGKTEPYEIHQILMYCQGRPENNLEEAANGRIHAAQPAYRLEYRSGGRARFLPERLRS